MSETAKTDTAATVPATEPVVPAVADTPVEEEANAPPARPPRPQSPFVKAVSQLKEAFPDTDDYTLKAVLIAAQGRTPYAVNALLSASDPDYKPDFSIRETETPRPEQAQNTQQHQIESDEAMARRLAREFERGQRGSRPSRESTRSGAYSGRYEEERPNAQTQRSFIDDDLPEIRDNLAKGFEETRTRVTGWVNNFRKRLEGDDEQMWRNEPEQGQRPSRRSPGLYDRDPQELNDDFQGVSLRDDTDTHAPPKPARPGKPAVSALGGEDDDDVPLATKVSSSDSAAKKTAAVPPPSAKKSDDKWEPLSSIAPEPETDKDPFFIGESDDEEEEVVKSKKEVAEKVDKPVTETADKK